MRPSVEWTSRFDAWTFDLCSSHLLRACQFSANAFLWHPDAKKELRSFGGDGDGHAETAGGIKTVCAQCRPVCPWRGGVGRRQHGKSSIRCAARSVKEQVAARQFGEADDRRR